ncbi:hypothetical protein ACPPVT_07390 [Angustibacter sp. McL0619]|uniref:hypothetical protein n=1 Tax=Angustibacter sp. McL0619 TaxID=3415676 RepID=UPI003CF9B3C1
MTKIEYPGGDENTRLLKIGPAEAPTVSTVHPDGWVSTIHQGGWVELDGHGGARVCLDVDPDDLADGDEITLRVVKRPVKLDDSLRWRVWP